MALTDNLVSYWKLDETSGTRSDSHGSNNLTDNNTVTYTASGKINNAGTFTAANSEYLSITDASQTGLDITTDLTISAWMYITSAPTSGNEYTLVSKLSGSSSSYGLRYFNNGGTLQLAAFMYDSSAPTTNINYNKNVTLSTSTWNHIVYTFKSSTSTAEFYVNGSSIGTVTDASANDINNSTAKFTIGAAFEGANRFMNGNLDEIGIWSRVITSGEVTSLYNSGSGFAYPFTATSTFIPRVSFIM